MHARPLIRLLRASAFLTLLLVAPGAWAQEGTLTHAPTGLIFPAELAGVPRMRVVDYEQTSNNKALGMSYHDVEHGQIDASIYVYDANDPPPDGTANPAVARQFERAQADIEQVARQTGKYVDLRRIAGPDACVFGRVAFRCAMFSAKTERGTPIYTWVLISGHRGHYVKIRLDWPQDLPASGVGPDKLVRAFTATGVK